MKYEEYCIKPSVTVKDAMKVIDENDAHIVFIVDDRKLVASLTDGDVRRFLLKGGNLVDLAVKAGNKNFLVAKNEIEAQNLYHQRNYVAIPIVNSENRIIDVYIGKNSQNESKGRLNIPVVINAGGKGTRLEPYTKILPKPLIPVGELPIIEHIMKRFVEYGCKTFSMIVNYKKELLKAYFAECDRKYDIAWYNEEKPLGTGGGLCFLKGKICTTFFFTNCDSLLLSDYESMLHFHQENKNAITMICAYKNLQIPYGVVEMGINGLVETMKEKPEMPFLINTGIYIVEPEILDYIENNVAIGFPDIIEKVRQMGKRVAIYPVSEKEWLDMGQMPELEKMRKRLYGE